MINLDDPAPKPAPYVPCIRRPPHMLPPKTKLTNRKRKDSKENRPDWKAPQNIAIYLSKIELPDLDPNRRRPSASGSNGQPKPVVPTNKPAKAPAPPACSQPIPTPATSTTNGKSDDSAKLKKPNKVFSNPFNTNPGSDPTGPPTKVSKPAVASPPAMPGAWAPAAPPPPPAVPPNRPPTNAGTGGSGNGAGPGLSAGDGSGKRLSALQKLVQISRK